MSGIGETSQRLGTTRQGAEVEKTAAMLHSKGKISDDQLKELMNGDVGPQDVAIGNAVVKALSEDKESLMDGFAAARMNTAIMQIQSAQLAEDRAGGPKK